MDSRTGCLIIILAVVLILMAINGLANAGIIDVPAPAESVDNRWLHCKNGAGPIWEAGPLCGGDFDAPPWAFPVAIAGAVAVAFWFIRLGGNNQRPVTAAGGNGWAPVRSRGRSRFYREEVTVYRDAATGRIVQTGGGRHEVEVIPPPVVRSVQGRSVQAETRKHEGEPMQISPVNTRYVKDIVGDRLESFRVYRNIVVVDESNKAEIAQDLRDAGLDINVKQHHIEVNGKRRR